MNASRLIVGLSGPELTSEEKSLFCEIQPAGYILFSRNLVSAEQIRRLTDSLNSISRHRPFISIDQEGGRVWRTREFSCAPPDAATFSKNATSHQIAQFGALTGQLLEILGINLNFAPVLDLDHFPEQNNDSVEDVGEITHRLSSITQAFLIAGCESSLFSPAANTSPQTDLL